MQQLGKVVSETPGRRFVISDVHGCAKSLEALLAQIDPQPVDQVFFLGDYINKGPSSKATLDLLLQLRTSDAEYYFLRGNHDQKLIDFYESGEESLEAELKELSSAELLHIPEKLKQEYKSFLDATDYFFITGNYILVHAGLDFSLANPFRDGHSMLNIRGFAYDSKKAMRRSIIHGHYPSDLATIKGAISSRNKVIPLDNGCVYPEKEGQGQLLCLELESWTLFAQPNIDQR
jgi:serine/threonine protein phosphatase 1